MSDKKPLNFRILLVMIIFFIYSIILIYTGIQEPTSIFDIIMGIVILLMVFILLPKDLRTTKEDIMLKWEKEREKGKKYFMFVQGPLFFGFPMAIVLWISDGTYTIKGLIIKLAIFYVIGMLMGLYTYSDSEKKYQRWKYNQ
jgi:Mn2+/Fe2+ NRAMP family transporter